MFSILLASVICKFARPEAGVHRGVDDCAAWLLRLGTIHGGSGKHPGHGDGSDRCMLPEPRLRLKMAQPTP